MVRPYNATTIWNTAMIDGLAKRNLAVLSISQAFGFSGLVVLTTVISLAGRDLAGDASLATLPMALQMLATMLTTIPASLIMGRIGRRAGFLIGQTIALAGGLVGYAAIAEFHSFGMLCLSGLLVGTAGAVQNYYRFAAIEATPADYNARAVSWVLAGGVIACFVGPALAKLSVDWISDALYAGTYLAYSGLAVAGMVVMSGLRIPRPHATGITHGGRPLREIARQPTLIVAVASAMIGYAMMALVMTATPLAMDICGHSFSDTASVIQWHVFAMFAPSFFTGTLIRWYGVTAIIMVGCVFTAAAMIINLTGIEFIHFWMGLFAIGIGWNFMFIGGTTLLAETYTLEEKSKVQALNDFCVFSASAAASFSSGVLLSAIGWQAVNYAVAVPVTVVFATVLWLHVQRRRAGIRVAEN
ncbi:MAG: MFS transporter [Rhodospirillales bacterium]